MAKHDVCLRVQELTADEFMVWRGAAKKKKIGQIWWKSARLKDLKVFWEWRKSTWYHFSLLKIVHQSFPSQSVCVCLPVKEANWTNFGILLAAWMRKGRPREKREKKLTWGLVGDSDGHLDCWIKLPAEIFNSCKKNWRSLLLGKGIFCPPISQPLKIKKSRLSDK